MLLKVYVTDTMLPSITIHNFINVALFLIELLIYLEDVVEFVKKKYLPYKMCWHISLCNLLHGKSTANSCANCSPIHVQFVMRWCSSQQMSGSGSAAVLQSSGE